MSSEAACSVINTETAGCTITEVCESVRCWQLAVRRLGGLRQKLSLGRHRQTMRSHGDARNHEKLCDYITMRILCVTNRRISNKCAVCGV